ncbi:MULTISPECIES: hypothetical protein [unclassified Bradyrhizobium]|uniref:hypothetical protein n=1 Tax=unclassified Bradyrhizobium TaxID=2631580 RepID=UPI002FEE89AF
MAYAVSFEQSNTADWNFQFSATDLDTNEVIDFSGATDILFVVADDNGERLRASLANGKITLESPTVLDVRIPFGEMGGLCAGSYQIGAVYKDAAGDVNQLLTGRLSVYNGIAKL